MYFNKIAITLLVIFSICASFVIGFFGRDFFNQVNKENEKKDELVRQQFLMQISDNKNIVGTSSDSYESVL